MAKKNDIVDQLNIINKKFDFNYEIKPEQKSVIISLTEGKDTIAVLPTGFGKTFCAIAPMLIKQQVSKCKENNLYK